MAAVDTFDWFAKQVWATPDEGTRRFLKEQRDYLLTIRSENERLLFIEEFIEQTREMKKARKTTS